MSSPFLSAEPVQFTQEKQPENQPETQETQELKLPGELNPLLALYSKIVEDPKNITFLWNFTQNYLTFLESKSNLIVPIIKEMYPGTKENNLILLIKEISIPNIPWSIHNCFLTITNIGTNIAKKEIKDEKDKFYLMYVMLSVNNDSPTYSFTELLQTLQQDQQIYNELNNKFLEAFKKYESPCVGNFLGGIDMKWVCIGITIFLLILLLSGGCYFYNKQNTIEIDDAESVGSIVSILSS